MSKYIWLMIFLVLLSPVLFSGSLYPDKPDMVIQRGGGIIILRDLDGDEKAEIIFPEGSPRIYKLTGDTWEEEEKLSLWWQVKRAILEDLNGDGKLDLVLSGNLAGTSPRYLGGIYWGKDGSFSKDPFLLGSEKIYGGGGMTAGDFNGDGKPDLAFSTDEKVFIFLGKGGKIPFDNNPDLSIEAKKGWLTAEDLDKDGKDEIVWSGCPTPLKIFKLKEKSFEVLWEVPKAYCPSGGIFLKDFSNDGIVDMLLLTAGYWKVGKVTLFLGEKDVLFLSTPGYGISPPEEYKLDIVRSGAVGDMDGDGDLDVVVGFARKNSLGKTLIYLNDGKGNFKELKDWSSELGGSVSLGDINGDGKLDIAISEPWGPWMRGKNVKPATYIYLHK